MNWSNLIEAGYLPTLIQEDDPRSAFAQLKAVTKATVSHMLLDLSKVGF